MFLFVNYKIFFWKQIITKAKLLKVELSLCSFSLVSSINGSGNGNGALMRPAKNSPFPSSARQVTKIKYSLESRNHISHYYTADPKALLN